MPAFPATADARNRSVRQYNLKAGQSFALGAAVLLDATPEITECGADPAAILGFACEPTGKDPEGATTKMLVAVVAQGERFFMSGTSNPVAADVNVLYGIVKDANGIWTVDKTDVVNTRVYVHAVDTDRNLYLVSVKEANRQIAA